MSYKHTWTVAWFDYLSFFTFFLSSSCSSAFTSSLNSPRHAYAEAPESTCQGSGKGKEGEGGREGEVRGLVSNGVLFWGVAVPFLYTSTRRRCSTWRREGGRDPRPPGWGGTEEPRPWSWPGNDTHEMVGFARNPDPERCFWRAGVMKMDVIYWCMYPCDISTVWLCTDSWPRRNMLTEGRCDEHGLVINCCKYPLR